MSNFSFNISLEKSWKVSEFQRKLRPFGIQAVLSKISKHLIETRRWRQIIFYIKLNIVFIANTLHIFFQINGTQQQLQLPGSGASGIAAAAVITVASDCGENCSSNGTEHQQHFNIATTTATSATEATMPAMAKEKASATVSLGESNFRDINLKDLAVVVEAASRLHHQQNVCGCGAVSSTENNNNSRYGSSKYLTNGKLNSELLK